MSKQSQKVDNNSRVGTIKERQICHRYGIALLESLKNREEILLEHVNGKIKEDAEYSPYWNTILLAQQAIVRRLTSSILAEYKVLDKLAEEEKQNGQ